MLKRSRDTAFLDRRRHIIGTGLHRIGGIAHCDTDTGIPQHSDIVKAFTESHRFIRAIPSRHNTASIPAFSRHLPE